MATIVFQGYAFDDSGAAIVGATVHIYARNTTTPALEDAAVTTDANGLWTATQTLLGTSADLHDIEIINGTTKRRRKYDDKIQLDTIEVASLRIRNPALSFRYDIVPAAIVADRTLNLPLIAATDTLSALGLAQTYSAAKTFSEVIASAKGMSFPATQVASADANTLDDYEEGTWTPVLTFATPGNLNVAYTTQVGRYTKIGELVIISFGIVTSTFTHTTASGVAKITGAPFTSANITGMEWKGILAWAGITKASYTDMAVTIAANTTNIFLNASGSAQALDNVGTADMPTGGTVALRAILIYRV